MRCVVAGALIVAGASGAATAAGVSSPSITTYSLFDSQRYRADAVAAAALRAPADPAIGARLSGARVVHRDGVRTVSAVPAAKAPCLISAFADGSQGVSCGLAADEPPVTVSYDGAIGLVPDAVQSVTFTMSDGTRRVGTVSGNVWIAPDEARKASYFIEDRAIDVDLMPRSSLPKGAALGPDGVVSGGP